jgi:hypothetical protein
MKVLKKTILCFLFAFAVSGAFCMENGDNTCPVLERHRMLIDRYLGEGSSFEMLEQWVEMAVFLEGAFRQLGDREAGEGMHIAIDAIKNQLLPRNCFARYIVDLYWKNWKKLSS